VVAFAESTTVGPLCAPTPEPETFGQIVVHDIGRGTFHRMPHCPACDASDGPVLSRDGHSVAYYSARFGQILAMVGDIRHGTATGVCQPIVNSNDLATLLLFANNNNRLGLSANGRRLLFSEYLFELVPYVPDHAFNVYALDLRTGFTRRISDADPQSQVAFASALSSNGRYGAFGLGTGSNINPYRFVLR
jgi:Tol biopolymer transport system component